MCLRHRRIVFFSLQPHITNGALQTSDTNGIHAKSMVPSEQVHTTKRSLPSTSTSAAASSSKISAPVVFTTPAIANASAARDGHLHGHTADTPSPPVILQPSQLGHTSHAVATSVAAKRTTS